MKKGPSVMQVARKAVDQHVDNAFKAAVEPVSDAIKKHIASLVEKDIPEMAEEILMMDIQDIVATVLDFVRVYQKKNKNLDIEILLEHVDGLIKSITDMVHHNPVFIEETVLYFEGLKIDRKVIVGIVISNITSRISGLTYRQNHAV